MLRKLLLCSFLLAVVPGLVSAKIALNQDFEGFTECHVTYEFSGIVESGSGTFVIDARRTNYSPACPGDLIDVKYPALRRQVLQIQFEADGTTEVRSADSGELLTHGEWEVGRVAYNTPEKCTIF